MDDRIKKWKQAESARKNAEKWNDLPNSKKDIHYSEFKISIAHCSPPKLVRSGQQHCGGKNYWDTEEGFNQAILKYLVDNWDDHYPKILEILKAKELDALMACQSYIDEMQELLIISAKCK